MHAVDEVNVDVAAVHVFCAVALGDFPAVRMGSFILRPDVRLGLGNHSRDFPASVPTDEKFTEKPPRNGQGRTIEEYAM
jgi:hypothetical protein